MVQNTKSQMVIDREKREIQMTRVFNAPRDLVFQVSLDPNLIPQWWGPRRYTTTVDHMDARPGGTWRFVQYAEDGGEHAFHGTYREIVPPERLVQTFEYEGMPGHEILEIYTFEDLNGQTKVTVRDIFQTLEDLEGMAQSGMEEGAVETNDRLEELLERIAIKK